MRRIFVPSHGAEDWRRCLADPEKHWRDGYSAKCLAECWEAAEGLPPEVAALFDRPEGTESRDPELLLAIPEYQVHIPGGGHPSQTDLFVLMRTAGGLMTVAVEGKVAEAFGPTLGEWRQDFTAGKKRRLGYIQEALGIEGDLGDHVRYQLLHRMASAVHEAVRFGATAAALVVHSFSAERAGFDAYSAFTGLFGADAQGGALVRLGEPKGIRMLCGWAQGGSAQRP